MPPDIYFLIQFVTKHYSRRRATIREAWAESLYFLDGRLADAAIEANRKNKTIETFLAGEGDEIEIAVKNVAIDDLREAPYRATVDFEKVFYTQHDRLAPPAAQGHRPEARSPGEAAPRT